MKKSKKKQLIMTMLFQAANLWQKKCNDTANGLTLRQFMLLSAIKNSEYQFISFAGLPNPPTRYVIADDFVAGG